MKKLAQFLLFFVITNYAIGQTQGDSLVNAGNKKISNANQKADSVRTEIGSKLRNLPTPGDSLSDTASKKIDSVRTEFQAKVDSLQQSYKKPLDRIESERAKVQQRIDSLQSKRLPTGQLSKKLDSLKGVQSERIAELNQKVNKLKENAGADLKKIKEPPQMQGSVDKAAQSIKGYNIPVVNGKIPNVDMSSVNLPGVKIPTVNTGVSAKTLPGVALPSVNPNIPAMSSVQNAKLPGMENFGVASQAKEITNQAKQVSVLPGQVPSQAGEYKGKAQAIVQGKKDELKNLEKTGESKLMNTKEAGAIGARKTEMEKYKEQLNTRPDSATMEQLKKQAAGEVRKQATDHFAGHEAVLQKAMNDVSKLKSRYTEVKSMAALPKKLPNPVSLLTFRERLIPGITFQLQSRGSFLVDINPLALCRLTPRFSAGAGFNYRFAINGGYLNSKESIYGPRAVVQYKWMNALNLRLAPELMNARVPVMTNNGLTNEGYRQWVWSMFVGLKTDFRISKSVRGNTEALFNLMDLGYRSPYGDRFVVRFGFEFPGKSVKR